MKFKTTLIIILLLGILFSVGCSGNVTIYYPAITQNGGDLIPAYIVMEEGKGLYINVDTIFGEDTQKSFQNAFSIATQYANKSCSIKISFDEANIMGPSGGLNTAFNIYLLLIGKKNKDIIATGGITEDGNITPVGGEYEKALAAKGMGYKMFITTPSSILDYYLLQNIEGLDVRFVKNFEDVLEIYYNNSSPNYSIDNFIDIPPLPSKQSEYGEEFEEFFYFIEEEFNKSKKEFEKIYPHSLENYSKVIESLKEKKLYYSAANSLFLTTTRINGFLHVIEDRSIEKEIEKVYRCIKENYNIEHTKDNFEYSVGAKIRLKNAIENLKKIRASLKEKYYITKGDRYYMFILIEEARLWCLLSQHLLKHNHGERINAEELENIKELAKDAILENENSTYNEYAEDMFIEGDYVTALYFANMAKSQHNQKIPHSPISFWGKVYASQYEYTKNSEVGSLSFYMDKSYWEIKNALQYNKKPLLIDLLKLAIISFLIGGVLFLIGRRLTC